jgi:hypothetical protein
MNRRLHFGKPEPNRLSSNTASMYNICYEHEEASSLDSDVDCCVIITKLYLQRVNDIHTRMRNSNKLSRVGVAYKMGFGLDDWVY